MATWYLIECLRPPTLSVVFTDGRPRDWTSVRAITRSDGIDTVEDLCHQVRDGRTGLDRIVDGRMGPRRVIMIPVLGFEGDVYGIKTWVGQVDEPPTPPRAIASVNWDIETFTARHTVESYLMSSVDAEGFGTPATPASSCARWCSSTHSTNSPTSA
ncbi:DUF5593 domain-containing protein [Gordonia sp. ABSL1-1]|uniref:GAF domain-containing protein n=1 Tax=Gordonia sp. ABSL1-1 TaxID=3053923 RepID=UPI0025747C84|nr:GAF domain-containing protein [Gordonia sp. ABSL1-1]MDL9937509.1 DUF5593 domain-containing protein [Gordonia sp. ABSL1-1]